MSDFTVGSIATLTYQTRVGQVLTDAAAVQVELQTPDGTVLGPFTLAAGAVLRDSVGTYRYPFAATLAGRYAAYWTSTGAATGSLQYEFDVAAKFSAGLANLREAKAYLNKSEQVTVDDAELQTFLDAASEKVTLITGITGGPKTATFPLRYGRGALLLPDGPIASVVSVVDGTGAAVDSGMYAVDLQSGTLQYGANAYSGYGGAGFWPSSVTFWPSSVTVTYQVTAGVPAPVQMAVLDLTADMWRSQRGSGGMAYGDPYRAGNAGAADMTGPQPRWRTWLQGYERVSGVA